jgi:hypothetical protein
METTGQNARPFNLQDAIILVAASSVGFIPLRRSLPDLEANLNELAQELSLGLWDNHRLWYFLFGTPRLAYRLASGVFHVLFPFLVCWTAALVVMRLRSPRPPWRDLVRQPGLWACLAAVVAEVAFPWWDYFGVRLPAIIVPGAVALAWLALVLTRAWRPERSWIDRAGRIMGLVWLSMFVPCLSIPVSFSPLFFLY